MARRVVTTDRDRGEKKVLKELAKIKQQPYVKIGAMGDKSYPEGTTVVDVATWMEFGVPKRNIPERSFIRATVDANQSKYHALLDKLKDDVIFRRKTVEEALAILGEAIQKDIVNRINAGIPPPNSERTIAAKGSDKPLIDTGQLKQSIRYQVKPKGGD